MFTTGDPSCVFKNDGGSWKQLGGYYPPLANRFDYFDILETGYSPDNEKFWTDLCDFKKNGYLMGAGTSSDRNGLFSRHAYSVLEAREIDGIRLMKLRNPHGAGEWTGAWGDGDSKWQEHSNVAGAVGKDNDADDGIFWMCYDDFRQNFDQVFVNYTSSEIHTIPDPGHCSNAYDCCCEPAVEFCGDSCKFWCYCQGYENLMTAFRIDGATNKCRQEWSAINSKSGQGGSRLEIDGIENASATM